MVFFSISIIKNFHRPSSVALLYSIGGLYMDELGRNIVPTHIIEPHC